MADVSVSGGFTVQGIGLSTYGIGGYADSTVVDYIANAKSSGANTVVLGNVSYVDLSRNVISDAYSGTFNQTARLADVDHAIQSATAQGISVYLKPQLVTADPAFAQYTSGSWINLVNPDLKITNPDAFFAAYKGYIMQWAALAEKDHVSALSIGNEMVAATKPEYTHYWEDIISSVRAVYHGQLTYSALLPTMTNSPSNEVTQIGFWNKLDFAGFDVYPSLATKADPTVAELNAGWHANTVFGHAQDYYSFVSDMAAYVGKPVVFTETGLPSFQGAADRETSSDGNIGSPTSGNSTAVTDYAEQANWWQSFFETWMQDRPAWLKGAFVWNNDPEDLGSSYANSYNIIGKPAEGVVASWYGGRTALAAMSNTLAGSQGNDQLYAYGTARAAVPAGGSALAATQETTVSVSLTGSIIAGTSPSFELFVNGHDYGRFDLKPTDSGYVTSDGIHFVTNQTYSVSLPGLQAIDAIRIAWVGDTQVNGTNATLYFNGVSVNGVALSGITYTTAGGYVQAQQFGNGTSSQWNGGSTAIDPSAWNAALKTSTIGTAANPIVVAGNGGSDVLHVLGDASSYVISRTADGSIALTENAGLNQNVLAHGVSSIAFEGGGAIAVDADGGLALSGATVQQLVGGAGDDRLSAAAATGAVVIAGGGGADVILGGAGNNHLYGNAPGAVQGSVDGADTITVGAGTNYVNGNAGNDTIAAGADGSTGSNRLYGGSGNDAITIHGAGVNAVNGNLGRDTIDAHDATGNNVLRGGQDDDLIVAGHGQDQLFGDAGNDVLRAGTGAGHLSVMTGGAGADLFDFSGGAASTVNVGGTTYYQEVTDFDAAQDHLHLAFLPTGSVLSSSTVFASVGAAQSYALGLLQAATGDHSIVAAAVGGDTYLFYGVTSGTGIDSIVRLDHVTPAAVTTAIFA